MSVAASKNPLYAQVHKILLDRILAGEWKPGERLPNETVLARETGVSLGTLRHAVEMLVAENVLVRREGVGTFVSTYRTGGYWNRFQPFDTVEASERYDVRRFVLLDVVPAPAGAQAAMGLAEGTPMIHIVRHMLRLSGSGETPGKTVTSVDELFLRPNVFKGLNEAFFLTHFLPSDSLYKFYDREFGVVVTRQKCAVTCEDVAGGLMESLRLSSPMRALRLDRVSYAFACEPVEYRIYRARAEEARLIFDLN